LYPMLSGFLTARRTKATFTGEGDMFDMGAFWVGAAVLTIAACMQFTA